MHVRDFLALPRPAWDWIAHDCCRWVDRYLCLNGYASPIEALAVVAQPERSALRVIAKGGGLVALWTAGMAIVGVLEADEPQAGDVGVMSCTTDGPGDDAMAIYTGDRWAFATKWGLMFGPAKALKVWRP